MMPPPSATIRWSSRPAASAFGIAIAAVAFAAWAARVRAADDGVAPGSVLVASCEGLSAWDRDGRRTFARFFVPEVPPAGAQASVVAWADMVYDGWRLPSGNHLCSAHEWVRELAPDPTKNALRLIIFMGVLRRWLDPGRAKMRSGSPRRRP